MQAEWGKVAVYRSIAQIFVNITERFFKTLNLRWNSKITSKKKKILFPFYVLF